MSNNFIFPHQGDPLLTDDALNQLEMYKQQLLANKSKMEQPNKTAASTNSWDETERELATLTEEQKADLMKDEQFLEVNSSIQLMLNELLNKILKPEMIRNEQGVKLLDDRLEIVRTLKKKIVKESNKRMELFKEYTEKHSDITWDEFLKSRS